MPTVYSTASLDGWILRESTVDWDDARQKDEGTAYSSSDAKIATAFGTAHDPTRGGGARWRVWRSFVQFDGRGITDSVYSATLSIYPRQGNTADFFVVKADDIESGFDLTTFDDIDGWTASGDQEGNVRKYSAEFDVSEDWNLSAYNEIALNSNAMVDMTRNAFFTICLIESVHDLRDSEPALGASANYTGMFYADQSGTTYDPKIDYEISNATFFGANF